MLLLPVGLRLFALFSLAPLLVDGRFDLGDVYDRKPAANDGDDDTAINSNSANTGNASFDNIAALDLDQRTIVARLASESAEGMAAAGDVFEKGAHSDSYAFLMISDPVLLGADVPPGSSVTGTTASGEAIGGITYRGSPIGDGTLEFHYGNGNCRVGGNPSPATTGCLAPSGTIAIDSGDGSSLVSWPYSYDPLRDNRNGISLSTLDRLFRDEATAAAATTTMAATTLGKFRAYYGSPSYDNEWIRAALDGAITPGFTVSGGATGATTTARSTDMDFSALDTEGRSTAVRWGIVVLKVWMFVAHSVEEAVSRCGKDGNNGGAVDRWDQAVAAYTGSEPIDTGSVGYFLYGQNQAECLRFGTCRDNTDGDTNPAPINRAVYEAFQKGRRSLLSGDCAGASERAGEIRGLLTVPLVQGILRTAHAMDLYQDSQGTIQGQASAFAAGILPLMHHCSAGYAYVLYDDLSPGKASAGSFEVIKDALEKTYECLGVTCGDIGGLTKPSGDGYLPGAEPCGTSGSTGAGTATPTASPWRDPTGGRQPVSRPQQQQKQRPRDTDNSLAIGIGIASAVAAALLAAAFHCFCESKRGKEFDTANDGPRAAGTAAPPPVAEPSAGASDGTGGGADDDGGAVLASKTKDAQIV